MTGKKKAMHKVRSVRKGLEKAPKKKAPSKLAKKRVSAPTERRVSTPKRVRAPKPKAVPEKTKRRLSTTLDPHATERNRSHSVLALGSRRDASYWADTAAAESHFTAGARVLSQFPSLSDLTDLFGRSDDWVYLAGHFTAEKHLHNDAALNGGPHPLEIHFRDNEVVIDRDHTTTSLQKGTGFKQHLNLSVLFWGGCNVHTDPNLVRTLRRLFGNVTMIGWLGVTGWQICHTVLGGFGTGGEFPDRDFFERVHGNETNPDKVKAAWLEAAISANFGDGDTYDTRFSVILPNGQEYVISDSTITEGRRF